MEKKNLLGVGISMGVYDDFTGNIIELAREKKGGYICVANVHMIIEAYDDPEFAGVINNADIVTPDGKPISVMLKFLIGKKQERVAGMDLFPDLIRIAEKLNLSVFFYGSTDHSMSKVVSRINRDYPGLNIGGTISPPFGDISPELFSDHLAEIRKKDPDIVFVVLGCPKQEKIMAKMSGGINSIMVGIGGAVPVFTGEMRRAPRWMQNLSLEWLFRLIQEPGRLWKRYFYTNSKFVFLALREVFRIKILKKGN